MVGWRVSSKCYLRSKFCVGDRTRLRKRTTAETQTLAVIDTGQFGHLTGDTLLTKILHVDKWTTSWQLGLWKNKTTLDKWEMKWPTLRIFKKILLRIAPLHLAHAIAARTRPQTQAMARAKSLPHKRWTNGLKSLFLDNVLTVKWLKTRLKRK